jgi:hypothetical protein
MELVSSRWTAPGNGFSKATANGRRSRALPCGRLTTERGAQEPRSPAAGSAQSSDHGKDIKEADHGGTGGSP